VQEITIQTKVIRFECARWMFADGTTITEELPKGYKGYHFGPELRSQIIYQSHHNRVPQEKIRQELNDKGVLISEGQISAILLDAAQELAEEKEQILEEGKKSNHLHADDTGARNKAINGFSTVIGNEFFSYLKSTNSKSRENFLKILNGSDNLLYAINEYAIAYAVACNLGKETLNWLQLHKNTTYTEETFNVFINTRKLAKQEQRFVTEACLLAGCMVNGLSADLIILSDDAGQFDLKIMTHALCWIHAERALKRIIPTNEQEAADLKKIQDLIWHYYDELKDYKQNPSVETKHYLDKKFDEIMSTPTNGFLIAPVLKKFRDNKEKLLVVLDNPNVPIQNNLAESDLRHTVIQRKISGGTRSDAGRLARDVFVSLFKTCKKNSISPWKYLVDRLKKIGEIPNLGEIVKERISQAAGP